MRARLATRADAAAIAAIYNQAIEDRTATFETALRSEEEILAWFDERYPIVVVEEEAGEGGLVVAFARASAYRERECYRGVFELGVYTEHRFRRRGAGALATRELVTQARAVGAWKLLAHVFVENEACRALMASLGFREVGTYYRHAKLDGRWRDVVIVEKFLAPIGVEAAVGFLAGVRRAQLLDSLRSPSAEERAQAIEGARSLVDADRPPDLELLEAAVDAFFMDKTRPSQVRARFVELFRGYAALSREAAQDLYAALFNRLERWSLAAELDAFYEVLFVVKQVAFGADGPRAPDLAAQVPRLLEWMQQAIELPTHLRTRISPGNVTALLMTLATAGCETEEQKRSVVELAAAAKSRHRVEPPVALRSSVPPPPPPEAPPPSASAPESVEPLPSSDVVLVESPESSARELGATPAPEPAHMVEPAAPLSRVEAAASTSTVEPVAPLSRVEAAASASTVEPVAPLSRVEAAASTSTVEPVAPLSTVEPVAPAEPVAKAKRRRRAPSRTKATTEAAESAGAATTDAAPKKKTRAKRSRAKR